MSNQLGKDVFIQGTSINVKAIRTIAGNKKFYTFLLEAKHLLKFCYAFRIETNNILSSYQRLLNPKKIRKISNYLNCNGYFANNILVATDENICLNDENDRISILVGDVALPDKPCYLEIIDGQHRLYGYANTRMQDHCLCVTVISGLDEVDRAKLFALVNKEQTKVPQYLLWDLYRLIEPNGIRGKISLFVQRLNEKGALKELIKLPRSRAPTAYLSFANICQAFYKRTNLFDKYGAFESFEDVINSFFCVIREDRELISDWKRSVDSGGKNGFLCTNNAIAVQLYLLARILKKRDEQGIPFPAITEIIGWKSYVSEKALNPIKDYFSANCDSTQTNDPYGALRKIMSNEAQRSEAAKTIFEKIIF